jgi:FtsZ-interacting cell division protein YlmF
MHNDSRHQTVIYYLHTLEECRDVITDLIDGKTVLLNLEEMDEKTIQRGIDTLCGAAFALNATLRKASDKTYLIAPTTVEVAMTNEAERHS